MSAQTYLARLGICIEGQCSVIQLTGCSGYIQVIRILPEQFAVGNTRTCVKPKSRRMEVAPHRLQLCEVQ